MMGGGGPDHDGPGGMTLPAAAESTSTATATPMPGPTEPVASTGPTVEVAMVDDRFDPVVVEIPAGTTIDWVNRGQDWHSVAAFDGSFDSGRVAPGEHFSYRFETPGAYQYICKHHGLQGMIGKVLVT
jgi:plastocyanin